MENPIYEFKTQIKESHLDLFGHVNNAQYLTIFEEARWDFLNKNGLTANDVMKTKKGPVLLELNLVFKNELLLGENITILSQARKEMRNKFVLILDQKILKSDGSIATIISLSVGLMDLELRKLIAPTKEWFLAMGYLI